MRENLSKFENSVEGRQFACQGAPTHLAVSFGRVGTLSYAFDAFLSC